MAPKRLGNTALEHYMNKSFPVVLILCIVSYPKHNVTFRLAHEQCVGSLMEWVSMAKQLHQKPYATKCSSKC